MSTDRSVELAAGPLSAARPRGRYRTLVIGPAACTH